MSGWYKQLRNITERAWFKDANMVQLYTYLKATAYVADSRYKGFIIRRGSCPTTRSEMSELTGMSIRTIDRTLKKLISFGEIIVKGNYQFSVITICDYDSLQVEESLFGSSDGIGDGTSSGISNGTTDGDNTPINIKEDKNTNTLISPYSPYKNERESGDLALEVKKRYNKEFDGVLPPCIRLSTATRIGVEECIRRFGVQSVDVVFEQIKTERFSLGSNRTGFIANFTFVFTPKNYQQYLERAQLAKRKGVAKTVVRGDGENAAEMHGATGTEMHGATDTVAEPEEKSRDERRCEYVKMWVEAEAKKPTERGQEMLKKWYEDGELKKYGIEWKPKL